MKQQYTTLLFDLDGTLVDSGEGIMRSAEHALNHFGIEVADYRTLRPFVGPPLEDSFIDFYGFTPEQAAEAVEVYRERHAAIGMYEEELYPGVLDFLREVKRRGYTTAIATSKMRFQADIVVKEIFPELSPYIDKVFGRDDEGLLHTKADVINDGLKQLQITSLHEVLMIGDRRFDIEGAKVCGLDSMGVLFGYGDRPEMEQAGADYICESYDEMLQYL